jgi:hypothetical protein
MDALQEQLNPWLGIPKRKQSEGRVTLTYRLESEEGLPLKLKVEINSREHFSILGFARRQFSVDSRWYRGSTTIQTYQLEELLGTKVRALYQRVGDVSRVVFSEPGRVGKFHLDGVFPNRCAGRQNNCPLYPGSPKQGQSCKSIHTTE